MNSLINTMALPVNPEAHISLQLLSLNSFHEEDDDEKGEEEDEAEEEEEEAGEDDHRDEEIENDNTPIIELKNDPLNHSISAPAFTSPSPSSYSLGRGRGSRPRSITPMAPLSAPVGRASPSTFFPTPSQVSTHPITTVQSNNDYPPPPPHFEEKPFTGTIDFSFNTSTTKIIFDNTSDYQKSLSLFKKYQIYNEPTRNYPDIWAFGLNSRTTRFYNLEKFYDEMLHSSNEISAPQTFISPHELFVNDTQFWLAFERRPTFNETFFNPDIAPIDEEIKPMINSAIIDKIKFFSSVDMRFSYGALTSMNTYYYHPQYNLEKRSDWTIVFRSKRLEIERIDNTRKNQETRTFNKTTLPADLVDRVAIFSVGSLGFNVYICTKGNLHESTRVYETAENRSQTERSSPFAHDCPTFSTICISAYVKNNPRNPRDKYSAVDQVKRLFKNLLNFFYTNQIAVCFARIQPRLGCIINPRSSSKDLTSAIQIYAFAMLKNVGYSVEQKLYQNQSICNKLLKLASGDDDVFYRLCLYLFRRSKEYHFLNLENEIDNAYREYKQQLDQCIALNQEMATILSPPRKNYAYVPSIRITPTTIQIQPLRLVRRHRILREMNFNDPMSLALIEIRDEGNKALYARDFRSLRSKFKKILTDGIEVYQRTYRYLHHSMSQVKEKQFWFLDSRYQLEDVLAWMGDFNNETVVAKHAARIAQCFTSTEPSIQIPAEHVKYIPDIETPDKQYCFTDGVGTLSQRYFKEIQIALGKRFSFSVVQIRYGGSKGTLSLDPNLDNHLQQLVIRESMRKFMSDHDQLEICKISSPRALYLNRQDILLLSTRGISDSEFLLLQNENHLWLVQALLCPSVAFELLTDRVGSSCFHFRDIANVFNLVEEPFFLQLLVTSGHDCVSKFLKRSKIRIAKNEARNMFGIVDEYGVLESGEVFIQYSHLNDEKLDVNEKPATVPPTILNNVKVVITKNPCHHPGDLRTFTAVDKPELRHLVDVIVFPQKGLRPHPNEISGSDLDGDEYVVIWYRELIPTTPNDEPYAYDSQEKPIKLSRPVERSDIIEVVLDIAAQNLTGDMSNLHLASADLLDARHPQVVRLAGLTSQELDAPKTGKHPITNEELNREYRIELLQERYPDFMMREHSRSYVSEKVIGQLFRSARRAIIRWHKSARSHCSARHLHSAQLEDNAFDDEISRTGSSLIKRQSFDQIGNRYEPSLTLDAAIQHPLSRDWLAWARRLFSFYRETLRNIISVFNYQDEIDLFCRCETLDQLASGKQDMNISAGLELQRLIDTTRRQFFYDFDQLKNDSTYKLLHANPCTRDRQCEDCRKVKLARAVACYYVCYSEAAKQSTKARSRILSFPWLFGSFLAEVKDKYQKSNPQSVKSRYIVIGRAMRNMAKRLVEKNELKLKILWPAYSETAQLFLRSIKPNMSHNTQQIRRIIAEPDHPTKEMSLAKILFIEIMNNWIQRQNIFAKDFNGQGKKPLIREICWHQLLIEFISMTDEDLPEESNHFEEYKIVFQSNNNRVMTDRYIDYINNEIGISSVDFDRSMYNYCIALIRLCFRMARERQSSEYAYLSDYLILALQAIGTEKELNDLSIDVDS